VSDDTRLVGDCSDISVDKLRYVLGAVVDAEQPCGLARIGNEELRARFRAWAEREKAS
jgi:hypothetical protein